MAPNDVVPEGHHTSVVYTAIRDGRFSEAVNLLTSELGVRSAQDLFPQSNKLVQNAQIHHAYDALVPLSVVHNAPKHLILHCTKMITLVVGLQQPPSGVVRNVSHFEGVCFACEMRFYRHLFRGQNFPRSRAALSLLSYCYYEMQDFKAATTMYEQLVKVCPGVDEYKVKKRWRRIWRT